MGVQFRRLLVQDVPTPAAEGELSLFVDEATDLVMTKDHEGVVRVVHPQPPFRRLPRVQPAQSQRRGLLWGVIIAVLAGTVVGAVLRFLLQ